MIRNEPFRSEPRTRPRDHVPEHLPSDSDDKGQFVLSGNVKVSMFLGLALQPYNVSFLFTVLLNILFSALEDEGLFSGAGLS